MLNDVVGYWAYSQGTYSRRFTVCAWTYFADLD
jgi:hypothetical protein